MKPPLESRHPHRRRRRFHKGKLTGVDFAQRKAAKKQSKRMSQKTEDGRRIREEDGALQAAGDVRQAPAAAPEARERTRYCRPPRCARRKALKLKAAARAGREKMAAKKVPGAAKSLSKV